MCMVKPPRTLGDPHRKVLHLHHHICSSWRPQGEDEGSTGGK